MRNRHRSEYHGTNELLPENGDVAIRFVFCKPMLANQGMEAPMLYIGLRCRTLHLGFVSNQVRVMASTYRRIGFVESVPMTAFEALADEEITLICYNILESTL